jgi:hypothetical protein
MVAMESVRRLSLEEPTMIAVIDINSEVRHECFKALSEDGIPVAVFHSTQTFVDSGAIFETRLLLLGQTRPCRSQCDSLRWARTMRPHLDTLLLKPLQLSIRSLSSVCNDPDESPEHNECLASLEAFRRARHFGLLRSPRDSSGDLLGCFGLTLQEAAL